MRLSITRDKLWLCLPIIVAELLDSSVTMLGQPAEYWKGSYQLVNEFNPFARWFMVIHPLGAIFYILLDIAAICLMVFILPLTLSKVLAAFWTIGSAKAVYNWLAGPLDMGWWISNIVLLVPAILLVYAFEKAAVNQTRPNTQSSQIPFEFPKEGC
jgi:hypothetical protein